jgi:hypothetical protein
MKAKAMSLWDRALLSKPYTIETIYEMSHIEHPRHLSMNGFMLSLFDVEQNSIIVA